MGKIESVATLAVVVGMGVVAYVIWKNWGSISNPIQSLYDFGFDAGSRDREAFIQNTGVAPEYYIEDLFNQAVTPIQVWLANNAGIRTF